MKKNIKKQVLTTTFLLFCVLLSYSQQSVSGTILYHGDENKPIEEVTVTLSDLAGNIIATDFTDQFGTYEFSNIAEGEYYINASTEIEPGGVDLEDAFLILLYLQGYQPLEPLAIMAGDVNGDGELNYNDIYAIAIYWYLYGQAFPADDWVFETLNIIVEEGKSKEITGPGGIAEGDVNNSFDPDKSLDQYVKLISIISQSISTNIEYTFPIRTKNEIEISSFGLSFEYPSELIEIKNVTSNFADLNFYTSNDELKISWLDLNFSDQKIPQNESIIDITFIVKSNTPNEEINFKINNESYFIDLKGRKIPEVTLNVPKFNIISKNEKNIFNFPNPFEQFTTIQYELKSDAKVSLKVFDLAGREVFSLPESFNSAGTQNIKFDGSSLESGIYFYNISVEGRSNYIENGSMIINK
ncbi:MAG: T9SS type A sorting domain-containing protein [Bacteroidales bacterium]|nr:T9SS type A sorting domain-containing protein [Bacteroidales bacterium]